MQIIKRKINHSATTNRSWRSNCQILNLKKHPKLRPKLNTLAVGKTKSHVVIKHSIHIFNPQGIDRAIKNYPISLVGIPFRIIDFGGVDIPNDRTCQPISPFLCIGIHLAIHFTHRNRFRVHNPISGDIERRIIVVIFHGGGSLGKHFVARALSTSRLADQHYTESDIKSII